MAKATSYSETGAAMRGDLTFGSSPIGGKVFEEPTCTATVNIDLALDWAIDPTMIHIARGAQADHPADA